MAIVTRKERRHFLPPSDRQAGTRAALFMVIETAIFTAVPGKEDELGQAILRGIEVVRQHPGCLAAQVTRCIENPGQYLLINTWASLEAHMVDFRGGPLFKQWRSHINGLFVEPPVMFHYQELSKE